MNIYRKGHNVNGSTVMWDVPIVTGRQILANCADTALHDEKRRLALLIDVAIPDDSKLNKKKTGRLRFGDRGQQDVVSDDKSGVLGTLKKRTEPSINPGHPSAIKLQTITQMSTACIIHMVRDDSVGIKNHYGLDVPGIESQCGRGFRTRPDGSWGPPSLQWVPGLSRV